MVTWLPVVSSESCKDRDCKCEFLMVSLLCNPSREANKKTGICTSVTSCHITHVSLVTHGRVTLPQAKDRLSPLIWAQHAAVVHAGALQGTPFTPPPPHFLEGSASGAWKLPNSRIFTRWRGAPLSSHLPLHWPALQPGQRQWGCLWKKNLAVLYHPLFTNNVSWFSSMAEAFPLCGSPFWLCWY